MSVNKFVQQPIPRVGPVAIIRENVRANFDGCRIVQHGGSFRLDAVGATMALKRLDALWIIEELALGASSDGFMRRIVVWKDDMPK